VVTNALLSTDTHATGIQQLTKNCPMGQIGQVEDVASMVSYLASKEAQFITGSYFY
jgi:NAD(P)-dependent dehydrogenase (short-subunit alcohol dehydrogenase family)